MVSDLSERDYAPGANEGAWMDVIDDVDGIPFRFDGENVFAIHLIGNDSDIARNYDRAQLDKLLEQQQLNRPLKRTARQLEERAIDELVSRTIGWRHLILDKQKVEFSPVAAKKLYARFPDIREQAAKFIERRANFLKS